MSPLWATQSDKLSANEETQFYGVDPMKGRIVIDDVHPRTPTGLYPAKASVGERIQASADIFKDGHDILAARLRWRPAGSRSGRTTQLALIVNDRWEGEFSIDTVGMHDFVIEAWVDHFATW